MATKQLQQWYSIGENYIQILPIAKQQKCSSNLQVEVIVTQQGRVIESNINIHYKVI